METVAVFDVGKTNVKLVAVTKAGELLDSLSRSNPVYPAPPYSHHDLGLLEMWLLENLRSLGARYAIEAIVATGHGSGGVLVGQDGPLMPMIDYEQEPPAEIARDYPRLAGSFRERGSPCMLASAHLAKQMLWLERAWSLEFAAAKAYLAHPQYWAWRLSGVMASEVTNLAAQSHLWCTPDRRLSKLADDRGWGRLIPPLASAWATLGTLKPELAHRTGLSENTRILTGIHDSSANLYRYQRAGFRDFTVVSTGTWIALICDRAGLRADIEQPGLCCNADVFGAPLHGMLVMGGREFSAIADGFTGPASRKSLDALISTRTMALPSFGTDDCLFPGSSRNGKIVGALSQSAEVRFTLAVLYAALLTNCCLDGLATSAVVLDGSFVRDPLYGAIVAALRPERSVHINRETFGTVTGAALLATHAAVTAPRPLSLERPLPIDNSDLIAYARQWREQATTGRAS